MPTPTRTAIRSFLAAYERTLVEGPGLKHAAVLIPLIEHGGSLRVLFTKRTDQVEHHKGQISFPGGMAEPQDADCIATALRETEEETGIARSDIEVLGICDDFRTPTGFRITPVVGYLASMPQLRIHNVEVDEAFTVPLDFFLDPRNERIEKREHGKTVLTISFFDYGEYCIWGATAAILRRFLHAFLERQARS